MDGWVWLTPFVGAFIGWLTNFVAIKMLFRPREPWRILGVSLQGVMPKRHHDLALKIGEVVERELLNPQDILEALNTEELKAHLASVIESRVDRFLREKVFRIGWLYANVYALERVQKLKRALIAELVNLFPQEVEAAIKQLVDKVNIGQIVAHRVEQFEFDRLENLVYRVARMELRWVEYLGGVLGFIIGLLQVLFTWAVYH
ncbi:MAG: DUF445 family protein [Nitrospinae bacterium]|nr:DUF445 family protein [Nitrospinota bacterium]